MNQPPCIFDYNQPLNLNPALHALQLWTTERYSPDADIREPSRIQDLITDLLHLHRAFLIEDDIDDDDALDDALGALPAAETNFVAEVNGDDLIEPLAERGYTLNQ